ncbi:selenocysteine-specific translation elongation factor [Tardiphaga sp. 813_E8_N1_3]|uniref:selenocysteine-specific translation elongation factor n=1 Tax=Tardiphaga sp. 813_E8_N1_3 TaxID=3240760 RepID=UPI003F1E6D05
MIFGTAGHIDHGKTALVKALTGVDGDRLKEEKARGITIDLGFAYLSSGDAEPLGFVDVPGHERFVHTMLAGASGIDHVLLVVAADDGVMPQTLEHLAIVDLLGIGQGSIVVTKADLVSSERVAEVAASIRTRTVGTPFEQSELFVVSAVTGEGIDVLRQHLLRAAKSALLPFGASRFRLAIDRVFTLQGIGVVVTGTILSGSVRVGDDVVVSPAGLTARVRSLHAQNRPAESARAGDRCALNLAGERIAKQAIHRGDVALDPYLHAPTDRIEARLRLLASEAKPVRQWFPARLHHASVGVGAHIVLLSNEPVRPGETADVQIVLERPIAATAFDCFVVRDVSGQRTIGGGTFIDLRPPVRRRRTPERILQRAALAVSDPALSFRALLNTAPFAWDLETFARDRALAVEEATRIIDSLDVVLLERAPGRMMMAIDRWRAYVNAISDVLASYHSEFPDRQGIGREKLRSLVRPKLDAGNFSGALHRISKDGDIVLDGSFVRLATHSVKLTDEDEAHWASIAPLLGREARFRPPRVRDIAGEIGCSEADVRRLMRMVEKTGRIDQIAHDHYFLRSTVHEMVGIVGAVSAATENGFFSAAQFRDRVDNGRKVAIQILDFFDRYGITSKRGDLRRANRHRLDLFAINENNGRESSLVGRSDFKSG